MRALLLVLSAVGVMGLAFWAYRENYETQQALRNAEALQLEIADLREELGVLRAEWAYLNRPDRLRQLAAINFDRLGLLPFAASQFGRVDEVAYPPEPLAPITNAIDVVGQIGDTP
jgi:cell division protein FtsL